MSTAPTDQAASLEIASVLFMDIVGYSLEPMERQSSLLQKLQAIVRATPEFQRSQEQSALISLPTGDGMALVFFTNPIIPVECALNVSRALKQNPELRLRMGVHAGPVYRIADINAHLNVAGGGINIAQRVMDCGDSGHVLLSSSVAEVLSHLSGWPEYLKDLGEHSVKHGVRLHLYALCTNDVLNHEIPQKLRSSAPVSKNSRNSRIGILVGAGILLAGLGIFGVVRANRHVTSPVVTPPVSAGRELSYWVTVQKYRDGKPFQEPFRLASDINFEANYRIRLGFRSPQRGYLYLLNEGPVERNGVPAYNLLFPSPGTNNQAAQVEANTDVLVPPAGKKPIIFDEQQGTEKLWMVWADHEIPALAPSSVKPEDGGTVSSSDQITEVRNLLSRYSSGKVSSQQDDSTKSTIIRSDGDLLIFLRKLEHH